MGLDLARSFGRGTSPSKPDEGLAGGWGSYPIQGWITIPGTPDERGVKLTEIGLSQLPFEPSGKPTAVFLGNDGMVYGEFSGGWALLRATADSPDPYVAPGDHKFLSEEIGPVGPGGKPQKGLKPTRPTGLRYEKDLAIGSVVLVGLMGGGAGYMLAKGKMNPLVGSTIGGGLAMLTLLAFRPGGWLRQG
jgi:hypothetical protein